MREIKKVQLNRTSHVTSVIPDTILESPKKKNLKTRQILRTRVINNQNNPDNSLSVDIIHEVKSDDGSWGSTYVDLRKLKEGESVRIQLDSTQTKCLYENLYDYYAVSKIGVGDGNRFVISGVNDIANIIFADTANKKVLAERVINEISNKEAEEIILSDKKLIKGFFSSLPQLRLNILESLKVQLESKLGGNEKDVQNWIDENKKIRCMVFGLEFVDYKREVSFGNSRFDVLTEQSGVEHVIIEMKSPKAYLFDVISRLTTNGEKKEYVISPDLSEAIPQVIKYFDEYKRENEETFLKNGVSKKKISKAIIVIGRSQNNDPIWQEHFNGLRHRLSGIEILTYDHLIEKITNQIDNLKILSNEEDV